ncbi:bifunctional adenosylcobinamide kinase/adenosylcobinamide-phosphate guanylyltransferase [Qingshengfaniella alkalisoli]|uniref:Bifunctional adenosylcobalamin biosynthesis protein n=1 Tax=Qingshengfaniella alkalisoli TaxID=2599296 RepID=A0A5B8IXC4_9RHOB|nr:bifunctional adenosylcobinamide kinase/adenosylcobinamide-phosphate guanylyltransferase [Qingshengfaniella alkalisoli]QDY69551.1 bifunctional adenosylcobinamide kinase/adenosylcobinamide-phosphate guanylyltransferase [Qingshengfaniella alkalisoli]
MGQILLVTGGARSGKSRFAEMRARSMAGDPVYIATAQAFDEEMAERIIQHRTERRGQGWQTIEEPLAIAKALRDTDGAGPRLLDCLTLWLNNVIHAGGDWRSEVKGLVATLAEQSSPVVLVTNEVGFGIVPDNPLARAFRDAAGFAAQMVAEVADEVVLVVAGYPVTVKTFR